MKKDSERGLADQTRNSWERNAKFWDAAMGEGNSFHLKIVAPTVERLLNVQPGQRVLDLACGNGHFSRRLCELGAIVVAADFSAALIELAASRLSSFSENVQFRVVDITVPSELAGLATLGPFDHVVSNMALMDIADLGPLAAALPDMLLPSGDFVFSTAHPCFNAASGIKLGVEEEDREGELHTERFIRIVKYSTASISKSIGIVGQPEPIFHFHRSFSDLLRPFLTNGLRINALEEPTFTGPATSTRVFSWEHYVEIPPVLAVKMRR